MGRTGYIVLAAVLVGLATPDAGAQAVLETDKPVDHRGRFELRPAVQCFAVQ